VYRPFEFVIPGTTDAADEMVRHIGNRQPLRQSKRQWLDIEVTRCPAGRAFDLEEFAVPCKIADCHWLDPERLGLATAAGPVPIALELDELGQTSEQSGDCLSLNVGQPLVRDGDGIPRLAIHMSQETQTLESSDVLQNQIFQIVAKLVVIGIVGRAAALRAAACSLVMPALFVAAAAKRWLVLRRVVSRFPMVIGHWFQSSANRARPLASITRYPPGIGSNLHGRGKRRCGIERG
jgi:hypothetical protein